MLVFKSSGITLLACTFVIASTDARSVSAADPQIRATVQQLFDAGWGESLKDQAAAEDLYASLRPDDPLVIYTYALIQAKHRRYEDAVALLDEALAAAPDQPSVIRAKIWFLLLQRKGPPALAAMERLGRLIGETPPDADQLPQTQRLEHARFLGRMYGYLTGPASEMTSRLLVESSQRKTTEPLDPEQQEAFADGKQAVLLVYDEFVGERDQELAEAAVRAEELREEELQKIADRREELAAQRTQLDDRRARLQDDQYAALAKLNDEHARVARLATPVEADVALFRQELAYLVAEIARLQLRYDEEEDPDIRRQIFYRINRLDSVAAFYERDLIRAEQQLAGLLAQRNDVLARRQQTQAAYARQLQAVDAQLGDLNRQERRLDGERERLDRASPNITRRARSLGNRAGALLTYEPFPFEQERQRILKEAAER